MAQTAQQILFQNSLAEVVRQLRANKNKERETIEENLETIKGELRSSAQSVKVTAVVKLTYFCMLGYGGDHGAFNIIEVMADPLFHNKRVGYVAAAVIFHEGLDLLPLITAQVKKDLLSTNQYEIGLALYCISCVCTPDLARDLVSDVVGLLTHQRPYVRKKAVLCLYKIFLQFPDALRPTYPKLKEKIDDSSDKADNDPSVRSAVVNVLCELARRNPANFLNLVVPFFSLLNTVHNNWTLIKIIKVFGHFAPIEPRLGKKLVDPITNLITTSPAKSVQYECLYAVANGMSKVPQLTKLAADKIKLFVEEHDQNLKYLGLDAMSRIIIDNPKLLIDQRDTILQCLDDPDNTIRVKALVLLQGLTTRKNLITTVNNMFDRVERFPPDEDWSNLVIEKIIETVKEDDYALVQDFEWYLGVLLDLATLQITNFKHGALINKEFIAILTRVNAVRQYGVESLATLLSNEMILSSDAERSTQWNVLCAAAFACGEFPQWIPNKGVTLRALLSERLARLPAEFQLLAVGAAGKIHAFMCSPSTRHVELYDGEEEGELPEDDTTVEAITPLFTTKAKEDEAFTGLDIFCHSPFPDVQEKALFVHHIVSNTPNDAHLFYDSELTAVAEGAQKFVTIPDDLDLDAPFADMPELMDADSGDDFDDSDDEDTSDSEDDIWDDRSEQQRQSERDRRAKMDAYYLRENESASPVREEDLPPVESLDLGKKSHRHAAGGRKSHTISKTLAGPQGFTQQQASRRSKSPVEDEATRRLKHINVGGKLGKEDVLPTIQPYKREDGKISASPVREASATGFYEETEAVTNLVYDGDHCSLALDFSVAHAKKDVCLITLSAKITNKKESHSMYNVTLLTPEDFDPNIRITSGIDPNVSAAQLTERLKGSTMTSTDVTFSYMTGIDFVEVPLKLQFVAEKREKSVDFVWSPTAPMVLKRVEEMPSEDYNTNVMPNLTNAVCMSAQLSLPKKCKIPEAFNRIRNAIPQLAVVDVLKDAVSLYGKLVIKKSVAATMGHVAVLLQETGKKKLTAYVKCNQQNIAEQLVQDIAVALS